MLVLSRRVGEAIELDNGVTVKVLKISGKQIKLGIEAPDEVKIGRVTFCEKMRAKAMAIVRPVKTDLTRRVEA